MNEQMRRGALALLALGLVSSFGAAAAAQEIVRERYVVEDRYAPTDRVRVVAEPDDDDEDEVVVVNRSGMQRCAETFRSFDPSTGTYVTFEGETRPCPYLE